MGQGTTERGFIASSPASPPQNVEAPTKIWPRVIVQGTIERSLDSRACHSIVFPICATGMLVTRAMCVARSITNVHFKNMPSVSVVETGGSGSGLELTGHAVNKLTISQQSCQDLPIYMTKRWQARGISLISHS